MTDVEWGRANSPAIVDRVLCRRALAIAFPPDTCGGEPCDTYILEDGALVVCVDVRVIVVALKYHIDRCAGWAQGNAHLVSFGN